MICGDNHGFKRIPLGSETGGWGGESSRYGRVARVGGLSTGRFAIRNEFQDEVAWSLLALLPAHTAPRPPSSPGQPSPTRPRCDRPVGPSPLIRTPCGRGSSQQSSKGALKGRGGAVSPVLYRYARVAHQIDYSLCMPRCRTTCMLITITNRLHSFLTTCFCLSDAHLHQLSSNMRMYACSGDA